MQGVKDGELYAIVNTVVLGFLIKKNRPVSVHPLHNIIKAEQRYAVEVSDTNDA